MLYILQDCIVFSGRQAVKSYKEQRENTHSERLEINFFINHYKDFTALILSHHQSIFRKADKSVVC